MNGRSTDAGMVRCMPRAACGPRGGDAVLWCADNSLAPHSRLYNVARGLICPSLFLLAALLLYTDASK